jgi:type VI secretion system protein ImpL
MSAVIKLIKNKVLLTVIAILILIGLIIAAGHFFGLTWEWRIIGIMFVIFLGLLIIFYERMKAAQRASALEESIKAQGASNVRGMRPDKQLEIQELQEQLTRSIISLKKSKLGKGIGGKAALYALPWYMFIGPPGAGKTTAIENSGLEFPQSSGRIRGIGGTRNCDWFFSNSAILLDTAGRYTTEEEDREEWYAFLDILKKNRGKKPINGVIVGISIADLLDVSEEEVERHARIIRSRIDELVVRLSVKFPVYLVFTKCDLIRGFVEFFGEFSRAERDQVWGATFRKDQQREPDPAAVFENEIQQLYQSLQTMRLQRLSSPMTREERKGVYAFPLEFISAKDNLTLFVRKLFQPNPYQENPVFRGFYFTSGTQEGVPIDRVIQTIAKQAGLPPERVQQFDPEMETKAYFIKSLFTDVVIPDKNLGEPTSRMARQQRLLKLASFSVILLALILLVFGTLSLHLRFKNDLQSLKSSSTQVSHIRWSADSFLEDFKLLDDFRRKIEKVENVPFYGASIYRGSSVREPARGLFYEKLYPFMSQYIFNGILNDQLNEYARGDDNMYRDQAYNYLRAYLLMGEKIDILRTSRAEKEFLKTEILELTDIMLERRFRLTAQADESENAAAIRRLIKTQVEFFMDILAAEGIVEPGPGRKALFETNPRLVTHVRSRLGDPNIRDVYSRIKREGMVQSDPVTLARILNGKNADFFTGAVSVEGLYTQETWKSYLENEFRKVSRNPDQDDWVIGIGVEQFPLELRDAKVMEERLREMYFREYSEAWWNFLRSIQIRPFDDIVIASRRLKELGDTGNSPLRLIIDEVSRQTKFSSLISDAIGTAAERVGREAPQHRVEKEFSIIHSLYEDESGEFMSAISQFDILAGTLEMLINDPPEKTADFAARVIQQRSGDIPDVLRTMRSSMRGLDQSVRRNLFEQPVLLTWQSVLSRTEQYLNSRWKGQIYDTFSNTLAHNYPFDKSSTSESAIADVERFFQGSDGHFWKFYQQELQSFLRRDTWTPNTWEGMGVSVGQRTRHTFNRVAEITQGLGLHNRNTISLDFSLLTDLPSPAGILEQINLTVDGTEIIYRMGQPRWGDLSWPGHGGPTGAYIELQTRHETLRPVRFDGRWGWFRLLDEATIMQETPTAYKVQWHPPMGIDRRITLKYQLRASSAHNPFGKPDFFQLSIPQTLN